MNVPKEFYIIDERNTKDFSIGTFSGYKKTDVIKQFENSIINKNIEEACNWLVELHISGKVDNIWDIIFNISSKNININNPKLISWVYAKYIKYENLMNKFDKKYLYECRNNQEIRNLFVDIITILTFSDKTNIFDKLPKIKDSDLNYNYYSIKIKNNTNYFSEIFTENNIDNEFIVIINEIIHLIKIGKINNIIYWCLWLDKLHKFKKKNKIDFICPKIENNDINLKYHSDWIWTIWHIILLKSEYINSELKIEIESLYKIYKNKYTTASISKKQYILFGRSELHNEKANEITYFSRIIIIDYDRYNCEKHTQENTPLTFLSVYFLAAYAMDYPDLEGRGVHLTPTV